MNGWMEVHEDPNPPRVAGGVTGLLLALLERVAARNRFFKFGCSAYFWPIYDRVRISFLFPEQGQLNASNF